MNDKNKHITQILKQSHGIDVSKYDELFLNKSLQKRITETKCSSADAYATILKQNKEEGKFLLDLLQISYSEFFRNPLTFAVLERIVLPGLLLKKKNKQRKEIRIWSAACSTGQESYSLAMLLEELINGDNDRINYRIFATDKCESKVIEARKGLFSIDELNNLKLKWINQWFSKHLPVGRHEGELYSIKPELKENIEFSVFDLFSENLVCPPGSIFGDFDLVLCANLLFYYKNTYREIILEKTGKSLAKGGFLVAGEAEREILMNYNYHEVYPQSAVFQIK